MEHLGQKVSVYAGLGMVLYTHAPTAITSHYSQHPFPLPYSLSLSYIFYLLPLGGAIIYPLVLYTLYVFIYLVCIV